jgi:hypothetical protein
MLQSPIDTAVIQRNLLNVETLAPQHFKDIFYKTLSEFDRYSNEYIQLVFNKKLKVASDKNILIHMQLLEQMYSENRLEDIQLMAELIAISMVTYCRHAPFIKPAQWWKDITLQLIDVNIPMSETKH